MFDVIVSCFVMVLYGLLLSRWLFWYTVLLGFARCGATYLLVGLEAVPLEFRVCGGLI